MKFNLKHELLQWKSWLRSQSWTKELLQHYRLGHQDFDNEWLFPIPSMANHSISLTGWVTLCFVLFSSFLASFIFQHHLQQNSYLLWQYYTENNVVSCTTEYCALYYCLWSGLKMFACRSSKKMVTSFGSISQRTGSSCDSISQRKQGNFSHIVSAQTERWNSGLNSINTY